MKVKARSTGTIGWTLAGMVGSIFALENWGDAVAAVVCFMLVALWARPVRPRALFARLIPFFVFAVITYVFGAMGAEEKEMVQTALDGHGMGRSGQSATGAWAGQSVAALAAVRLLLLGVTASWMGLYVGAARMIAFLASVGRAVRRIGVDLTVPLVAMGVAIRFLPLLQEEARRLQTAWQARGAGLSAQGLIGRVRYGTAIAVPLMAAALRRAEALAEAIDVRLAGAPFTSAELWYVSPWRSGGHDEKGSSLRAGIGVAAAWCVVVMRVWRWVG